MADWPRTVNNTEKSSGNCPSFPAEKKGAVRPPGRLHPSRMAPPQPSCPDSPGKSCHVGTLSRLDLSTRNARSPCGVLWGHMPGPSATPAWFLCTPKAFRTSTGSTVERPQGEGAWSELAQESNLTAQPSVLRATQKAEAGGPPRGLPECSRSH